MPSHLCDRVVRYSVFRGVGTPASAKHAVLAFLLLLCEIFLWMYIGPSNAILANCVPARIRARSFSVSILATHALGDASQSDCHWRCVRRDSESEHGHPVGSDAHDLLRAQIAFSSSSLRRPPSHSRTRLTAKRIYCDTATAAERRLRMCGTVCLASSGSTGSPTARLSPMTSKSLKSRVSPRLESLWWRTALEAWPIRPPQAQLVLHFCNCTLWVL